MAIETPPAADTATGHAGRHDHHSYVDWPAILAGAILASAISFLFLTFGSAIGLSLIGPFGRTDAPVFWAAIAIALWMVWVQVSGFLAGGYVAGRLRKPHYNATEHEVDVRDGLHGLLVWATGVVMMAVLALGGLGHLTSAASNIAGSAVGAAATTAGEQALETDPFDYAVDVLFRGDTGEAGDPRAEATRIIVGGVTGDGVGDADRTYLAQVVASRTNLSQGEAEARVDEVIAQAQAVQNDIAAAAEQARRVGILVAFITAASLAVSAAAAYFAAGAGGNHRDKNTVVPFFNRVRQTT
ncbi:hypothetical protein [Pelagibacterium limicola]|uniref:hypothetical protein n=1 Tax=Pelagibacterium limicola TaxID=2791022 RepID=UPI0018AF9C28|nr:hypothetical protein [Pelagibacterium limicola]